MTKSIYIKELISGDTDSAKVRLPAYMLETKGLVVSGEKVEVTVGSLLDRELLSTALSSNLQSAPDNRVIPFKHSFKKDEALYITVRNNHDRTQQITVNLIS